MHSTAQPLEKLLVSSFCSWIIKTKSPCIVREWKSIKLQSMSSPSQWYSSKTFEAAIIWLYVCVGDLYLTWIISHNIWLACGHSLAMSSGGTCSLVLEVHVLCIFQRHYRYRDTASLRRIVMLMSAVCHFVVLEGKTTTQTVNQSTGSQMEWLMVWLRHKLVSN